MNMKQLHMVTFGLVLVGALNWGLVGLLNFNLVSIIADVLPIPALENIIYVLVGVSAVVEAVNHMSMCKMCGRKK